MSFHVFSLLACAAAVPSAAKKTHEQCSAIDDLHLAAQRSAMLQVSHAEYHGTLPATSSGEPASGIFPELVSWASSKVAPVEAVATSESSKWPALVVKGSWHTGLKDPRVYVLSLERDQLRRQFFAKQFNHVNFSAGKTYWMPAVNGFEIPKELSNPHGAFATGSEQGFREITPGFLGSYLSHLLIFRDHLQKCIECDLMVFEDDVAFHPRFRELWTDFMAHQPEEVSNHIEGHNKVVPVARLHPGGSNFWNRPLAQTETYYQVESVSRAWGYVVKAHALQGIYKYLLHMNAETNVQFDNQFSGRDFVQEFPVLAPRVPLLIGRGLDSATATASLQELQVGVVEDDGSMWENFCWRATYVKGEPCQEEVDKLPREEINEFP